MYAQQDNLNSMQDVRHRFFLVNYLFVRHMLVLIQLPISNKNNLRPSFYFLFTLIIPSVRCRLFLLSDDASPGDANFDGDNDIEDTVRLTRFLFG